jgi:uncharacterized protein YeaO (DUF488 family)
MARGAGEIRRKRAYEAPSDADGQRVLVERLWPRGVKKDALRLDEWLKDVAPSPELRRWFAHDPNRFIEFAARYCKELAEPPAREAFLSLVERLERGPLTLVYAASDVEHNSALVLQQELRKQSKR